jgi:hypothetical protein
MFCWAMFCWKNFSNFIYRYATQSNASRSVRNVANVLFPVVTLPPTGFGDLNPECVCQMPECFKTAKRDQVNLKFNLESGFLQ